MDTRMNVRFFQDVRTRNADEMATEIEAFHSLSWQQPWSLVYSIYRRGLPGGLADWVIVQAVRRPPMDRLPH